MELEYKLNVSCLSDDEVANLSALMRRSEKSLQNSHDVDMDDIDWDENFEPPVRPSVFIVNVTRFMDVIHVGCNFRVFAPWYHIHKTC